MRVSINRLVSLSKYALFLLALPLLNSSCNTPTGSENKEAGLSAEESLKHFQLEKGMNIHIVAAEPYVQAPVALQFDARGRIWAVEMLGYMPDTAGTGENTNPNGKIVILEDQDSDGRMDKRTVFLDSLILPRAMCFYDEGLLVAEPPKLWFVEIKDGDVAGNKYLVDSQYAVGGNVEHQPNGLLRGLDNWIYNAKSDTRYRRINGKWEKEHTHFRGQWGVTQDDDGRLFYNNNSVNLLGDYFLPSLGAWNPDLHRVAGFNATIVGDNRTYPIHPTPGVNRGYQPKVLDDSLRLVNFTAACGPVIYRSHLFGDAYYGNAFVAGPAANLIKRDLLKHDGFAVKGKQAYQEKEFLASDDERFRPVSLYNGPEGALYVVDMYRGIIQDVTYLTPYLKAQIEKRHLKNPLNRGRIYKITPEGKNPPVPDLSGKSTESLVHLLNSPDAWIRQTAQRLLTDKHQTTAIPLLRKQMQAGTFISGRIHTFWTLEGLGALTDSDIETFLSSGEVRLQQQAVAAIVSRMNTENAATWLQKAVGLQKQAAPTMKPYWAFLAAGAMRFVPQKALPVLQQMALENRDNRYVVDAVISGLSGQQQAFFKQVQGRVAEGTVLYKHLKKAIDNAASRKREEQQAKNGGQFARGKQLFMTYCKICHGENGEGLASLGPPLSGSQWVQGDPERLLAIVLHGLTGPIKVGDKVYKEPEIAGEMPAFGQNDKLSDEDIAHIVSFIRNAWNNKGSVVQAKAVHEVREKYKSRDQPYTMKDLEQFNEK